MGAVRRYRRLWSVACAALLLAGAGVGAVRSPVTFGAVFVASAVATAMVHLVVSRCRKRRRRASSDRLIVSALVGGSAAGAVAGLGEPLGVEAFAAGMVLLALSPFVLRSYARALTSEPMATLAGLGGWVSPPILVSPHRAPAPAVPDIRQYTDQHLRRLWLTSFLVLQARPRAQEAVAIVSVRQRYLDEFERRNPHGFEAWLACMAGASHIPASYLRHTSAPRSEIDWDELIRPQGS